MQVPLNSHSLPQTTSANSLVYIHLPYVFICIYVHAHIHIQNVSYKYSTVHWGPVSLGGALTSPAHLCPCWVPEIPVPPSSGPLLSRKDWVRFHRLQAAFPPACFLFWVPRTVIQWNIHFSPDRCKVLHAVHTCVLPCSPLQGLEQIWACCRRFTNK